MRSVYRRHFTLPGKLFPKLVGARDLTRDVLDQWYIVLQPVLRVPPLLGVLPVRHRHRRDHDGRQGDHGLRRPRPEVPQRDHRQGAPDRQQPRPARAGARRHARGPRGRRQGGDRRRRPLPARREGRRGAARHAVGRLLRRAARRQPDRLRQGVPRRRHFAGRCRRTRPRPAISACSSATTTSCARSRCASARRRSSSASSASSSASAATRGASRTACGTRSPASAPAATTVRAGRCRASSTRATSSRCTSASSRAT